MRQKRKTHIKDTTKVPDEVNQKEKKNSKIELKDKSKDIQEKGNHISGKKIIIEKRINNFLILLPFYKFIMKILETM